VRLRTVVIGVIAAGIALALVLAAVHGPAPWLIFAAYWAVALVAILVERGRYRPAVDGASFVKTPERYRDPTSGELITVYVDPATGERDYRPEPRDA
jgi:hypothetical protein